MDTGHVMQETLGKAVMLGAVLALLMLGLFKAGRWFRLFVFVPLMTLALLVLPARAQDPAPSPSPSPAPVLAPSSAQLSVEVGTGTASTRDTTDAFLAARATFSVRPFDRAVVGARGDLDRAQDGGELSAATIGSLRKTFRAIEAGVFARYYIARGISVGGAAAVTYAAPWGSVTPRDSRLYTGEAIACIDVDSDGYGCVGGGWRGPVGGYALSASVSRNVKGVIATIDVDFPLAKAADFLRSGGTERPYTVTVRAMVPLKRFKL